jgi:glutamate synthase domain-containing protein 3
LNSSARAALAGLIAENFGREGIPNERRILVRFEGDAGQSFGAWCASGMDLRLRGVAQDGVAKGISGGAVTVAAGDDSDDPPSVAGNNVAYGATGGRVFIGGRAGHRLGIRNSGATIVAEAAGKFAGEYMTRGRIVILGSVENEIGAGMTGGELFVLDPANSIPAKLHSRSVAVVNPEYADYQWLHPLVIEHHARSGSRRAADVVRKWAEIRRRRWLRKIVPLTVAHKAEDFITVGTNAG